MSKSVKVFLFFLGLLVTCILAITVSVNNKINTKEIQYSVKAFLGKAFPNYQVSVGSVDFSMGTVVRLYINEINVSEPEEVLINLRKVTCKLSVLSVLFGDGTIQMVVEDPILSEKLASTWNQHLSTFDKIDLSLPSYLIKNHLDLKIENLKFINNSNAASIYSIEKILFKNLSLKNSMAYEVLATVGGNDFHSKAQVIGELTLAQYMSEGKIVTKSYVDLFEIKTSRFNEIARIKTKLDLTMNRNGEIEATAELGSENLVESRFEIHRNKVGELFVKNLQGVLYGQMLNHFVTESLQENLNFSKSQSEFSGGFQIDEKNKILNPELSFQIKKPVISSFKGLSGEVLADMKLTNNTVVAKLDIKTLQGDIDSNLIIKLNQNYQGLRWNEIESIEGQVSANSLKFKRADLLKISDNAKKSKGEVVEVNFNDKKVYLPKVKLSVLTQSINIEDVDTSQSFNVFSSGDKISLENIKILLPSGDINAQVGIKFLSENKKEIDFEAYSKKFDVKDISFVLPRLVPNFTGIFKGKISGKSNSLNNTFNYTSSFTIENFIIDLIDLSTPINRFFADLGEASILTENDRVNSFSLIKANINANQDKMKITNASLINPKISILQLMAEISEHENSIVTGKLKTSKTIPFKYIGIGRTLQPDLNYSRRNKIK